VHGTTASGLQLLADEIAVACDSKKPMTCHYHKEQDALEKRICYYFIRPSFNE